MGDVRVTLSVRVNMEELADWEPERLEAFFAGVAKVLAQKPRRPAARKERT